MVSAIIACAGKGSRANFSYNKLLHKLTDKSVLEITVDKFLKVDEISQIILAVSKEDKPIIDSLFAFSKKIETIIGGDTRTQSIKNALNAVTGEIVLIHDGARPFVHTNTIKNTILSVKEHRSGIVAVKAVDTIASVNDGAILSCERDNLYQIQTPQGFFTKDIKLAYSKVSPCDSFLDDSSVYNKFIGTPYIVEGTYDNKKLTTPQDFSSPYRIGTGFDLHVLVENRKLILGGIEVPHEKGLLGHSDADVLTHAIMDAILSALALRDIGYHFPDTDPQYKGASSIKLLEKVLNLIYDKGYKVSNLSAVIMAQRPKLSGYVDKISANLAKVINIPTGAVGITCTTTEKVGLVGREQAISCQATALLVKI